MNLSIVTTLYESAAHIGEFHRRISAAAAAVCSDYELIFVNDGSPDASLQEALRIYEQDPHVRIIDLSRNFGEQKAMMTGLAHARGDLVFLTAVDLEEDPELLDAFYRELHDSGADVVYGVQRSRKGGWFERLSGRLFFAMFNLFADDPIPENVVATHLMTARYVTALIRHQEREVALAGLLAATGFEQKALLIDKKNKGSSSYTLSRKIALLVNAITSFSNKPLIYIFYLGMLITLLAGFSGFAMIIGRLFFQATAPGWASIMVTIFFFGGLMIFCQGLIGLYISRMFIEVKQRPYTIIRDVYERSTPEH